MSKWVLVVTHPVDWRIGNSIAQIHSSNRRVMLSIYRERGDGLEVRVGSGDISRSWMYARRGVDDPIVRLAFQLAKGNGNYSEQDSAHLRLVALLEERYAPKSLTERVKGMFKRVLV